ncbi:MAG: hypothetical protein JW789_03810 [Candidatus Aenigmarchaeota archaeon]|nr:hypothetical protein [Candidatus Aenigmarchaeota archaeon]
MILKGVLGTEMTLGSFTKLLMVVFVMIGFTLFITGVATNMNETTSKACQKYPELPFCSGSEDDISALNDKIAVHSTQALACAIKSEWLGRSQECAVGINDLRNSDDLAQLSGMDLSDEDFYIPSEFAKVECHAVTTVENPGKSRIIEYDGGIASDNVCYQYVEGTGWMWSDCDEELLPLSDQHPPGVNNLPLVHDYFRDNVIAFGNTKTESYNYLLGLFEGTLNGNNYAVLDDSGKRLVYNDDTEKISNDRIRVWHSMSLEEYESSSWADKIANGKGGFWEGDDDRIFVELIERSGPIYMTSGTVIHKLYEQLDYYTPGTAVTLATTTCKVSDFYLPQDFDQIRILGITMDEPRAWVAGFGDPEYIVYWQDFPQGEDYSWTSLGTWLDSALFVFFAGAPLGAMVKGTKYLIKGVGKTVISEAGGALASKGDDVISSMFKTTSATDESIQYIIYEEGVTKATRRAVLTEAVEKGFFSKVVTNMNSYYKGPSTTWLFTKAGVLTGAAWAAAYIDSLNEKFMKQKSSMVLKIPFADPQLFMIEEMASAPADTSYDIFGPDTYLGRESGSYPLGIVRPVMLDKTSTITLTDGGEGLQKDTLFYLASPCLADLDIKRETIYCSKYLYNSADQTFTCSDPISRESAEKMKALGFEGVKPCGSAPITLDAFQNNRLFNDNNNDGKWDEVVVYGLINEIDWLKIRDIDFDGTFDGYEAKIGNNIIVSTGEKTGKIDMGQDGTFDYTFTIVDRTYEVAGYTTEMEIKDMSGNSVSNSWSYRMQAKDLVVFSAVDKENILLGLPIASGTNVEDMEFTFLHGTSAEFKDPADPGPHPLKITDTTGDGKIDTFSMGRMRLLVRDTTGDGYWNRYDEDDDGHPDVYDYDREYGTIYSQYCSIEGITITPELKEIGKGNNFCYTRIKEGQATAIMVGSAVFGIVLEQFTGGVASAIVVGIVNTGIAYAQMQVKNWP